MKLPNPTIFAGQPRQVDILFFTRHLATMIRAGIPLTDAISTLEEQTHSVSFKRILHRVLLDVENGQSLAKSLAKFPRVFDQFFISLIEVSEKSGTLDENLEFVAHQLAKNYALKKKIQAALLYPGLIMAAAVIMGGFIGLYVLPQLADFFQTFHTNLPFSTRVLLFLANTSKNYGGWIAGGAVASVLLLLWFVRLPHIKSHWHGFLLRAPFIGELITDAQMAQLTRNFGVLIKSGVPIVESLEVASLTLSNQRLKDRLKQISTSLQKGKDISEAIESRKYREFPLLVSKMIAVGEKTGKLDESLLYLGDFYEEEIDNISKNLTTLLEPVMLIVIGLVVGFVALAIITPIYQLTGSIGR